MRKISLAVGALAALAVKNRFLAPGLAAAAALLAAWLQSPAELAGSQSPSLAFMADKGEQLLHGLKNASPAWSMPAPTLASALVLHHAWPGAFAALAFGLKAVSFFLVFTLGALEGAPLAGLLALLLAVPYAGWNFEQLLYAFALLAALNLGVARAAGSRGANAAAGFGFGLTLLVRPVLFLLPPVLLHPWFSGKANARPARALVFVAACGAALLPWALANYSIDKKAVIFERGRSDCNIISTVKRSDYTIEGDCRALAGLAPGDSALRWAAGKMLASPGAYAGDAARRFFRLLLQHPLLWLLALAGLAAGRGSGARLAGVCALYLGVFYSVFSFEPRYAEPLPYLLAFPAAAGLLRIFRVKPEAGQALRLPARILTGAFLAAGLALVGLLLSYSAGGRDMYSAVKAALERHPEDSWLLGRKANFLLWNDSTGPGLAALAAARAAELKNPLLETALGGPGALETERLALAALERLDAGRGPEAAAELSALAGLMSEHHFKVRGPKTESSARLLEDLKRSGDLSYHHLSAALRYWPRDRRPELLRRLRAAAPWLPVPANALPLNVPGEFEINGEALAAELLSSACAGAIPAGDLPLEYAYGYYNKNFPTAPWQALWRQLSGRDIRFTQEEKAALLNFAAAAEGPVPPAPVGQPALTLLRVCRAGGRVHAGWTAAARPEIFELAARLAGGQKDARALARLGEYLDAHPELGAYRHQFALDLQAAGEYKGAVESFSRLLAKKPKDPKLLNDRGVCRLLGGDRAGAESDFKAALAIAPGFGEAARNLAYLAER